MEGVTLCICFSPLPPPLVCRIYSSTLECSLLRIALELEVSFEFSYINIDDTSDAGVAGSRRCVEVSCMLTIGLNSGPFLALHCQPLHDILNGVSHARQPECGPCLCTDTGIRTTLAAIPRSGYGNSLRSRGRTRLGVYASSTPREPSS